MGNPASTGGGPTRRDALIEVVEVEGNALVVESPLGRLYGISFDLESGREVVNVTELERPRNAIERT